MGTTITLAQPFQQQQQAIRTVTAAGTPSGTTTYVNVGGHTAQVVNGVVTLPAGHHLTTDQFIKTEVVNANTPLAVQQIQAPDVSALLEAAVSQTEAAGFITSDPPVVANEEEIGHIVHTS